MTELFTPPDIFSVFVGERNPCIIELKIHLLYPSICPPQDKKKTARKMGGHSGPEGPLPSYKRSNIWTIPGVTRKLSAINIH